MMKHRTNKLVVGLLLAGLAMPAAAVMFDVETGGLIQDGDWEAGINPFNAQIEYLGHLPSGTDHLYEQSFWFSIDGSPEFSLGDLTLTDVTGGGNGFLASYGSRDAGDPLAVDVSYSLLANGSTSATLSEMLTITNLGTDPIDLSWFVYTDWDLNSDIIDQAVIPNNPASITQIDFGGTEATVTIVDDGGADALHWEVAEYSDLIDRFNDVSADTLADAETSPLTAGPADYTYAFQLDYLDLAVGESVTIEIEKLIELGSLTSPFDPILPLIDEDGDFVFDFPVWSEDVWWVDPVVAVGYEYINNGGPNFASVTVPGSAVALPDIGDALFGVYLFDPLLGDYDPTPVAILDGSDPSGNSYDFISLYPGGVDRFLIGDIEPEAGLDPSDPLAFVTGLGFIGAGMASFSMVPVSIDTTPVPAPAPAWLLGAAMLGLAFAGRRRAR